MSIHRFSAILIKRRVLSLINVLSLKDSAYITDWYTYKYSIEISDFDLESKPVGDIINKKIYNLFAETVNANICIRDRLSLIYF